MFMGIFHKAIDEIGKYVQERNLKKAKSVLEAHESACKDALRDANNLVGLFKTYNLRIQNMKAILNQEVITDDDKTNLVLHAKAAKEVLTKATMLLSELASEERNLV
jgi:hypothetical protein